MEILTKEQLSRYNGKDALSYVAYKNSVYDVSGSFHWKGGRHQVVHNAGEDQTGKMKDAPHGANMLERFPVVGILASDEG